eukprot:TRINITY_DN5338_c1_g1_i3.p1 TRINITY_DN5338_c1_g1~~TRINITY_DN5338_c1_g1_i3.p1  ORF type:complete len:1950 (+),score=432.41 TRINITY_DN5338_c1_g1_i3:492-5852(+)
MCDCGDETAWKQSGNCQKHRGLRDGDDPTEMCGVGTGELLRCREAVYACCSMLDRHMTVLQQATKEADAIREFSTIIDITTYLTEAARAGDGMRRVAAEGLCYTAAQREQACACEVPAAASAAGEACDSAAAGGPEPQAAAGAAAAPPPAVQQRGGGGEWTALTRCIMFQLQPIQTTSVSDSLEVRPLVVKGRSVVQQMLLACMPDFLMKHAMAREWCIHYERLNELRADGITRRESGITDLGVQFLTVPPVVASVAERRGDVPGLYEVATKEIEKALRPELYAEDKRPRVSEKDEFPVYGGEIICVGKLTTRMRMRLSRLSYSHSWNLFGPLTDIHYCWNTGPEQIRTFASDPAVVDRFLIWLLMLQQAFACHRVDKDTDAGESAVNIEYQVANRIGPLSEALVADRPLLERVLERTVRFVRCFVDNTLTGKRQGLPVSPPDGMCTWLRQYNPFQSPKYGIHFQLPLHRLLAAFVRSTCAAYAPARISDVLPQDLVRLMAHYADAPLALFVARAQVDAGMWRRNHEGIQDSVRWWSHVMLQHGILGDLYNLQVGCCVLGPRRFAAQLARRFGGHQPLWCCRQSAKKRGAELMADFLATVLYVATDRSKSLFSNNELMRRQVVHALAAGPKKHSELTQVLSPLGITGEDEDEHDSAGWLDGCLQRIGDYVPPTDATGCGLFRLKPDSWREVDPNDVLWNSSALQAVDQEYAKVAQAGAAPGGTAPTMVPPQVPPKPFAALRPVLLLLATELVLGHCLAVVDAFGDNSGPRLGWATDVALRRALDILLLALQTREDAEEAWVLVADADRDFEEQYRGEHGVGSLFPARLRLAGGSKPPDVAAVLLSPAPRHGGLAEVAPKGSGDDPSRPLDSLARLLHCPDAREFIPAVRSILAELAKTGPEQAAAVSRAEGSASSGGPTPTASQDAARKQKARAKQQQLLAQMQRSQAAISFSDEEDESECSQGSGDAGPGLLKDLDVSWLSDVTCACCHATTSPQGRSDVGLVAQWAQSRSLARARDPALYRRAATVLEGPWRPSLGEREQYWRDVARTPDELRQTLTEALQKEGASVGDAESTAALMKRLLLLKRDTASAEAPVPRDPHIDACGAPEDHSCWDGVDTYGKGNVHLHTCGHVVHLDCFDSHSQYQMQHAVGDFKGRNYVSIERGEFLCPLCGRLGNAVLPALRSGARGSSIALWAPPRRHSTGGACASPEHRGDEAEAAGVLVNQLLFAPHLHHHGHGHGASARTPSPSPARPDLCGDEAAAVLRCSEAADPVALGDADSEAEEERDDAAGDRFRDAVVSFCRTAWIAMDRIGSESMEDIVESDTPPGRLAIAWAQQVATTELMARSDGAAAEGATSTKRIAVLRGALKVMICCAARSGERDAAASAALNALRLLPPGEEVPGPAALLANPFALWVRIFFAIARSGCHARQLYAEVMRRTVELRLSQVLVSLVLAGYGEAGAEADPAGPVGRALRQIAAVLGSGVMRDERRELEEQLGIPVEPRPASADESALELAVAAQLLPLLRRLAIAQAAATAQPARSDRSGEDAVGLPAYAGPDGALEEVRAAVDALLAALLGGDFTLQGIVSQIAGGGGVTAVRVLQWSRDLAAEWAGWGEEAPQQAAAREVFQLVPLHREPPFVSLPREYDRILGDVLPRGSSGCGQAPQHAALCLTCGALLCVRAPCCTRGGEGACTRHTQRCGGGTGMFLLPKHCEVMLIRPQRHAYHLAPYVDKHGEHDVRLHRGRPLYLCDQRWAKLRYLASFNLLDFDTQILEESRLYDSPLL